LLLGHKTQQQIEWCSNCSNEPSFLALLSSWAKFWIFNSRRVAVDLSTSRFKYVWIYLLIYTSVKQTAKLVQHDTVANVSDLSRTSVWDFDSGRTHWPWSSEVHVSNLLSAFELQSPQINISKNCGQNWLFTNLTIVTHKLIIYCFIL
jgi:hypothetical protein